jgi:hypothetical protein
VRRNFVTFCTSKKMQKFLHQPRPRHLFLQERGDCARFAPL